MKKILSILFIVCNCYTKRAHGQCDTIANICYKHMTSSYISDGQLYRAFLLNSNETAVFQTTLFRETNYRIAGCSGTSDGNLIFSIYDRKKNLLFTNKDQKNAPYWDFMVKSTLDVFIESQLDANKNHGSGCAVLIIGFKLK